jgi:hypothetical protein
MSKHEFATYSNKDRECKRLTNTPTNHLGQSKRPKKQSIHMKKWSNH